MASYPTLFGYHAPVNVLKFIVRALFCGTFLSTFLSLHFGNYIEVANLLCTLCYLLVFLLVYR